MTLLSRTGPNVAENVAFVGHAAFEPAALVNFCLTIVIVLCLFEAEPAMLAASYVQVIGVLLTTTVDVIAIGLAFVRPLTVTGCPFLDLTVEL